MYRTRAQVVSSGFCSSVVEHWFILLNPFWDLKLNNSKNRVNSI